MSIGLLDNKLILAATTSVLVLGVSGFAIAEEHRANILEVYVFALSSGRSMLIRTPEDVRILVDGGSNADVVRELSKVLPFYSRRIDAVIATHEDARDITGLVDVMRRYSVTDLYIPSVTTESLGWASSTHPTFSILVDVAAKRKVSIHETIAGNTLLFGKDVSLKVSFPVKSAAFEYTKASAPEILFTISHRFTNIAYLGSASHKIQEFLSHQTTVSRADVLIVSHSAMPSTMSKDMIGAVSPHSLIYSKVLPKKTATTDSIEPAKDPLATILRQDRYNVKEKGTIKIVSDGHEVSVHQQ